MSERMKAPASGAAAGETPCLYPWRMPWCWAWPFLAVWQVWCRCRCHVGQECRFSKSANRALHLAADKVYFDPHLPDLKQPHLAGVRPKPTINLGAAPMADVAGPWCAYDAHGHIHGRSLLSLCVV